jgi:hypothetical protein
MILSLLLATLLSIPQINQADTIANSNLYIFQSNSLPPNAIPILTNSDTTLAFASANSFGGWDVLSEYPGHYYLLRSDIPGKPLEIDPSIPHIMFSDACIIKMTESQVKESLPAGWGLTRLTPSHIAGGSNFDYLPPVISDTDPHIEEMISAITPQSSRQALQNICSLPTRYSFSQYCRTAEQNIYNRFESLGLIPSYDTYTYSETTMRNVIGQLTGTVHPESIIIVCAHLDCTSEMPNTLAPGAEDNASGVAVVLEAARVFSAYQTDYTVRFIAFTGEEQGLIGSDHYAVSMLRSQQAIKAVLNVDMVGYSGPYAEDMHIFCDPNSYSLGALGASIITDYTQLDTITHYEQSPRSGSDHYPFAIRNYPAIFFIDAWDDFDWYPNYHSVSDTIGNLNMNQQAQIARAVTAMAAILARPDFGPGYLPGDANGSGGVNGIDVVYLVNFLKGGPPPQPLLSGDSNGDCNANGLDVVYLVNFLKGGRPPFLGDCK